MSVSADRLGHPLSEAVERDFVAAWWSVAVAAEAELGGEAPDDRIAFEFVCDLRPYGLPGRARPLLDGIA